MIYVLAVLCSSALAVIEIEPEPAVGVEVVISVRDDLERARAGETVRIVHRAGLFGQRELAVGITDGRGRVRWTPEGAGVVRIRAGDEIRAVRVPWRGPPSGTATLLAILALAALIAGGYGASTRAWSPPSRG